MEEGGCPSLGQDKPRQKRSVLNLKCTHGYPFETQSAFSVNRTLFCGQMPVKTPEGQSKFTQRGLAGQFIVKNIPTSFATRTSEKHEVNMAVTKNVNDELVSNANYSLENGKKTIAVKLTPCEACHHPKIKVLTHFN